MNVKNNPVEEKKLTALKGVGILILSILIYVLAVIGICVFGAMEIFVPMTLCIIYVCIGWIPWCGIKILNPNEAYVFTLFGKYVGTIKTPGLFFVNPFCAAINPTAKGYAPNGAGLSKKISLKAMTLQNDKQKINDEMGNPIEIAIIVIWRVQNTAKAVFNVENFKEFVSIQADSALRDVISKYPYDIASGENSISLRGSSQEVADEICSVLQKRVEAAGIEIIEARITHLAYAPEIASAMLQRQQAAAIIDAKQKIVEGAVGMVKMALDNLSENEVCELDEERKAAMVSNLLVVLCGNKEAQPIVNSGSIY